MEWWCNRRETTTGRLLIHRRLHRTYKMAIHSTVEICLI